jgi:hypothetical protein
VEAVSPEHLGDPGRREAFLESRLGICVDAVRQVDDLVADGFDGGGHPGLGVGMGFGRANGATVGQRILRGDGRRSVQVS